jgi:hypothetical protein
MGRTILIAILEKTAPPAANTGPVRCTGPNAPAGPWSTTSSSHLLRLALDACAKAECARRRWQAARLAGDKAKAERARQLMLRHQAIAYHLDPNRGAKHGSA